jgi:hypothetical protein
MHQFHKEEADINHVEKEKFEKLCTVYKEKWKTAEASSVALGMLHVSIDNLKRHLKPHTIDSNPKPKAPTQSPRTRSTFREKT